MINTDFSRAINSAQSIISGLYITEPSQIMIEEIAADRGAFVEDDAIRGSVARLLRRGKIAFIKVDSEIRETGRRRFAIAHELGHFELHKNKDQIANCTEKMFLDWYKTRPEEPEANTFAAEILMPSQMFKEYCKDIKPSFDEISNIAEYFKTTITATAIRYVDLGPHPCVLIVSENGIVKWFRNRSDFPYRVIGRGEQINKFSCANDFFTKGIVPSEPEAVSGQSWLEDWRSGMDIVLYEHAFALPRYNTVLSLVWEDY